MELTRGSDRRKSSIFVYLERRKWKAAKKNCARAMCLANVANSTMTTTFAVVWGCACCSQMIAYAYALRTCDLIAHQHAWSVVMIEICNNWCWVVLSVSINFGWQEKRRFFISIKLPRENERVDATCWWFFVFDTLKMRENFQSITWKNH